MSHPYRDPPEKSMSRAELEAEVARLRSELTAMHRRAQAAESPKHEALTEAKIRLRAAKRALSDARDVNARLRVNLRLAETRHEEVVESLQRRLNRALRRLEAQKRPL